MEKPEITFTPEEIETIKKLIEDWGFEYSLRARADEVRALAKKLGVTFLPGED